MASRLKINGVVPESIVDGPGFRYTVFVQGCPHHCPGCHNPQTHDFEGGRWVEIEDLMAEFAENSLLAGVTFSGGEPFCQPAPLCEMAEKVRAMGKNVMVYSGYTLEQLLEMGKTNPDILRLLRLSDTLVDGPYIAEQRDLTLQFRGSRNQRVIDLRTVTL